MARYVDGVQDQIIRQRDFSTGEINIDAMRRDDVEAVNFAVRRGQNMVTTSTGAIEQRPGRRRLFLNDGVVAKFSPYDGKQFYVVFRNAQVVVYNTDGDEVTSFAAPWTEADLIDLVWQPSAEKLYVTWSGRPQVITVTTQMNWTIEEFTFLQDDDGARRMPFYRFPPTRGVTMRVSARAGSIKIFFSRPILQPGHQFAIFRYGGRQVFITDYINPKTAKAFCTEILPKTQRLVVNSGAGFRVGKVVETENTGMQGEITRVSGNDVYVVWNKVLTEPDVDEKLVTESKSAKILSVHDEDPGDTTQWDEQFISNFHGWPRSVSKDRERLIFTDFPQFKNAIVWSAIGTDNDMAVGGEPPDAMFEYIDSDCQVFHVIGGYDQFALTDKGVYFIPVSVGTPLQPGSVEFRRIVADELSSVRPVEVTEGVIYVDKSGAGVFAISATGQTARPYIANEINRLHRPLFSSVKALAVSSGTEEFPARQIYALNGNGTMVTGQFSPDREYVGWLPWNGTGEVQSIAADFGQVLTIAEYPNGSVGEVLDYNTVVDCMTTVPGAGRFLELKDGEPFELDDGELLELAGVVASFYASSTVSVFGDGKYLGEQAIGADGSVDGVEDYDLVTIGYKFDWLLVPLFARFEGGQPAEQGEKKRKIGKMLAKVHETRQFEIGGRRYGKYRAEDDDDLPIPLRSETYRYRELGRSYDPYVEIKSTMPGPFRLIELFTRITV